jgi:hypothetical protein
MHSFISVGIIPSWSIWQNIRIEARPSWGEDINAGATEQRAATQHIMRKAKA